MQLSITRYILEKFQHRVLNKFSDQLIIIDTNLSLIYKHKLITTSQ